jgi:hypothetical protein
MKEMEFGYCDTDYDNRNKNDDYFDLVIFTTTTNQEYIEKAKSTEDLEFYDNAFYIMVSYNRKTKRMHISDTELCYITNDGDLKSIAKIKDKEDLKEIKEYLRERLQELV